MAVRDDMQGDVTEKQLFVCHCFSHGITAEYDSEWGISLAFWFYGYQRTGWRWRLRKAWEVLRNGKVVDQEVLLTARTARRLGDYLVKIGNLPEPEMVVTGITERPDVGNTRGEPRER